MTSKGDGLLRSNLPLGDTILRGASYFVTERNRRRLKLKHDDNLWLYSYGPSLLTTHISGQKPRGRQLNAKVCDSKSAIFRLLSSLLVTTFAQTTITLEWFKHSP